MGEKEVKNGWKFCLNKKKKKLESEWYEGESDFSSFVLFCVRSINFGQSQSLEIDKFDWWLAKICNRMGYATPIASLDSPSIPVRLFQIQLLLLMKKPGSLSDNFQNFC